MCLPHRTYPVIIRSVSCTCTHPSTLYPPPFVHGQSALVGFLCLRGFCLGLTGSIPYTSCQVFRSPDRGFSLVLPPPPHWILQSRLSVESLFEELLIKDPTFFRSPRGPAFPSEASSSQSTSPSHSSSDSSSIRPLSSSPSPQYSPRLIPPRLGLSMVDSTGEGVATDLEGIASRAKTETRHARVSRIGAREPTL